MAEVAILFCKRSTCNMQLPAAIYLHVTILTFHAFNFSSDRHARATGELRLLEMAAAGSPKQS